MMNDKNKNGEIKIAIKLSKKFRPPFLDKFQKSSKDARYQMLDEYMKTVKPV